MNNESNEYTTSDRWGNFLGGAGERLGQYLSIANPIIGLFKKFG
jgi:hypothetical protein